MSVAWLFECLLSCCFCLGRFWKVFFSLNMERKDFFFSFLVLYLLKLLGGGSQGAEGCVWRREGVEEEGSLVH